jgi:RimJ/RimL family protein N-acetyltransferase
MLPTEIRTPRLLLRPWRSEDAAAMKDAVDSSLDHLRASVAWARAEPTPLSALAARLEAFAAAFAKGEEWIYAVLDRSNSRALVEAVFAHLGAQRVAICHDPANVASGAVPRRLGFTPHGVVTNAALPARQAADGSVRATTAVWTLEAPR